MITSINKVFIVTVASAFIACTPLMAQEHLYIFENMKQALMESDEEMFKAHWYTEGYEKNLVGGSGISGSDVYKQGKGKWYLKPVKGITKHRETYIVPCQIWSWEKEISLDFVYAAVIKINEQWLIIGAGENFEEVQAMVDKLPE